MIGSAHIPGGYVLLSRKLLDSDIMHGPPLYLKLFVWMLLKAQFKAGRNLARGQFFTIISDMRNAMAYRIGYRVIKPSVDQIRSAYEALLKAAMITTTKTLNGMVVTVLNYDKYQNPANYEDHNEHQNEDLMKPGVTPQPYKTRRDIKKNLSSEVGLEIATRLAELITARNPKFKKPDLSAWARHVDLMLRIDGRDSGDIRAVVGWCQHDLFWQNNILSTGKLRKNFDQLYMRMTGNSNQPTAQQECPAHRLFDPAEALRDE